MYIRFIRPERNMSPYSAFTTQCSFVAIKHNIPFIAEAEQLFYGDVAKAKENNTYYEDIKKNIRNTDDADSLARQLAKRYSER